MKAENLFWPQGSKSSSAKLIATLPTAKKRGESAAVPSSLLSGLPLNHSCIDVNFRTMIEVAIANNKPVRIGVNWGSLDQSLLTRLMDENSKLDDPKDARDVTMEAMVLSALRSAELAVSYGLRKDQIILGRAGPGVAA